MNTKDVNAKRNYTLRLPDEIHERLEKDAAKLGISKNAYITQIIKHMEKEGIK